LFIDSEQVSESMGAFMSFIITMVVAAWLLYFVQGLLIAKVLRKKTFLKKFEKFGCKTCLEKGCLRRWMNTTVGVPAETVHAQVESFHRQHSQKALVQPEKKKKKKNKKNKKKNKDATSNAKVHPVAPAALPSSTDGLLSSPQETSDTTAAQTGGGAGRYEVVHGGDGDSRIEMEELERESEAKAEKAAKKTAAAEKADVSPPESGALPPEANNVREPLPPPPLPPLPPPPAALTPQNRDAGKPERGPEAAEEKAREAPSGFPLPGGPGGSLSPLPPLSRPASRALPPIDKTCPSGPLP